MKNPWKGVHKSRNAILILILALLSGCRTHGGDSSKTQAKELVDALEAVQRAQTNTISKSSDHWVDADTGPTNPPSGIPTNASPISARELPNSLSTPVIAFLANQSTKDSGHVQLAISPITVHLSSDTSQASSNQNNRVTNFEPKQPVLLELDPEKVTQILSNFFRMLTNDFPRTPPPAQIATLRIVLDPNVGPETLKQTNGVFYFEPRIQLLTAEEITRLEGIVSNSITALGNELRKVSAPTRAPTPTVTPNSNTNPATRNETGGTTGANPKLQLSLDLDTEKLGQLLTNAITAFVNALPRTNSPGPISIPVTSLLDSNAIALLISQTNVTALLNWQSNLLFLASRQVREPEDYSVLGLATAVIVIAALLGAIISSRLQWTVERRRKEKFERTVKHWRDLQKFKAEHEQLKGPPEEEPLDNGFNVVSCFFRMDEEKEGKEGKRKSRKGKTFLYLWNVVMGIIAAGMTPLFLKTVSSNLLEEASKDRAHNVQVLVLFGFCLVAVLSAQRFITLVSGKVFDMAQNPKSDKQE